MTSPGTTLITLLCALTVSSKHLPHPLSDEFIDLLNAESGSWTAGRNFPSDTPMEHIQRLRGTLKDEHFLELPSVFHDAEFIASLPESFDPRDKWPNCPSLNEIRDQGSCGSCWAFGAVEAMTDRVCTYSNGTKNFHFSAEDLVSCCVDCGYGCNGGIPSYAWEYWRDEGIVSGGGFNSNEGCRPYTIKACKHNVSGDLPSCEDEADTPECIQRCISSYNISYENDKHYGKHVYSVLGGEENIKAELFKNGPVEAGFTVYTDFLSYKTGVYKHKKGGEVGGHAVKIMGWGVEDGKKYWLIANSWNTSWGEKGYFKMLRGEDHCGIESEIVAGEPLLS